MMQVKISYNLTVDEVNRILNALNLRYDKEQKRIYSICHGKELWYDEITAGIIIGSYISAQCSFEGVGVESVIEYLEKNDESHNIILDELWQKRLGGICL